MFDILLSSDLNRFNEKSIDIDNFKEQIKKNILFKKIDEFNFLPKEYLEFLNSYLLYPDRFLELPTYSGLYEQFIVNYKSLKDNEFELLSRKIGKKNTFIKYSIIVCFASTVNDNKEFRYQYYIINNYKFGGKNLYNNYYQSFYNAFKSFMTFNL